MEGLLQHSSQPAAFCRVTHRIEFAGHAELPHQPQNAVVQLRQMQDQVVDGELARGQALQVEVVSPPFKAARATLSLKSPLYCRLFLLMIRLSWSV